MIDKLIKKKKTVFYACLIGFLIVIFSLFLPYYEYVCTDVYYPDYSMVPRTETRGFMYVFMGALNNIFLVIALLNFNIPQFIFLLYTFLIPLSLILLTSCPIRYLIKRNRIQIHDLQELFKLLLVGALLYLFSLLETILIPGSVTFLCGEPQIFNPKYGIFVAVIASLGIISGSIWGLLTKD